MRQIKPMKCQALAKEKYEQYLNDSNYIAERKYDGSRYTLQIAIDGVFLQGRRESVKGGQVDKTKNVPQIVEEMKGFPKGTIFDGEIDVPVEDRNFKFVQGVMGSLPERAIQLQEDYLKLSYKIFDILELNGEDLRSQTFAYRRRTLELLFFNKPVKYLKLVEIHQKNKEQFLKYEIGRGAEGIMLKNLASKYIEGKGPIQTWYKIKHHATYDGIVLGYNYGAKGGKYEDTVGALCVYQYVNGTLVHTADVGGIADQDRVIFKGRLDKGERIIVEFDAYGKFEKTHKYRHPTFVRVRTDKNEKECIYGKA